MGDESLTDAAFVNELLTKRPEELARVFVSTMLEKSLVELTPTSATERQAAARLARQLQVLVAFVKSDDETGYQLFLRATMRCMDEVARTQHAKLPDEKTIGLYRAFDKMDEVLGIQYDLDRGMASDPKQKERLYEGAGLGVQTSYSSILLALERAKPKYGANVLDLGSGYGRVGFVIGLLRPDFHFAGYEYVDHRVQDSKAVAARAKLTNVEFHTQDLSRPEFKIPRADIYYMYDPFCRDTYGYVLDQLLALGTTAPITIITKGRANTWVKDALMGSAWSVDESCDSGTVSLFRSEAFAG